MGFLERLSQKYYSRVSDLFNIDDARKLFQLNVTAWITLIYYSFFGILSLFNLNYFHSIILGFGALISLLVLIFSSKIKNKNIPASAMLIAGISILVFLIFTGGAFKTGLLWVFVFPVIVISYYGHRTGGLLSIILFFIAILVFISTHFFGFSDSYNLSTLVRFVGVYLIIFFISYFFELEREIFNKRQEKFIQETKSENKKKDDFLSTLSHQIRTPLNNLTMVSNLIDRDKLDTEHLDLFDTIIASTNNLINVVNNIVKVSKADIDEGIVTKTSFDLYSTIDNTLKLFRNQYKEEILLDLIVSDQLNFNIIGDPIRLKQIFLNLIENIIKVSAFPISIGIDVTINKKTDHLVQLGFSLKCPTINVYKYDKENYFIKNTGSNIPEQEDNGLDLNIANKIIEFYNGKLDFQTNERFSTFSFTLELMPDIKKQPEIIKSEIIEENPALFSTDKKVDLEDANILLVEDNAINQKIVILSLKSFVKNIDVAFNGKEALDKFGKSKYDLILMDIQMPVMNGIVATKKIRELEVATNSHIPIIAITANALSGDKETCLAAGMNDYISKPFQIDTLIAKMKNLIE